MGSSSNMLADYIMSSRINYIYPQGTLPSNLFFRKTEKNPYWLANLRSRIIYCEEKDIKLDDGDCKKEICNSQWTFCGYPNYLSPLTKTLIPSIAPSNQLINQPIGMEKAKAFAKSIQLTDDYILSTEQFQCLLKNTQDKEILYTCIFNLTNSCGNKAIYEKIGLDTELKNNNLNLLLKSKSLSSYGLSIFIKNDKLLISSDCLDNTETDRSCKEFNKLLTGSLEKTAEQCGFLISFLQELKFGFKENLDSVECQNDVSSSCLASKICKKTNQIKYFGVSTTPVLWTANFILLYSMNPELGALMPGYIQNIPPQMANKLLTQGSIDYQENIQNFQTC